MSGLSQSARKYMREADALQLQLRELEGQHNALKAQTAEVEKQRETFRQRLWTMSSILSRTWGDIPENELGPEMLGLFKALEGLDLQPPE